MSNFIQRQTKYQKNKLKLKFKKFYKAKK